jgi:antirestriction protein ArdC
MVRDASRGHCAQTAFPYQGINVLMLWSAAFEKGYATANGGLDDL